MNTLIVYLNTTKVGVLEQDDSGLLQFSYDQAWLEKPGAIPLSRSLPLQRDIFIGKKARPFFAGILPEEEPRKQIARILGISNSNDFAMLARIGGECAGAVSLVPEGVSPSAQASDRHRELSEEELRQIVAELPQRPLMAGTDGVRLSLAGVQDKLPVVFQAGRFSLPLDGTPSTHILKPEPDRFPGLSVNELFCMSLARASGFNVPDTEYFQVGDKPCILIRRYDRKTDVQGHANRIHQEDFCQALGFPPERKYQAEGGPVLRDCISLLREWSTAPVLDVPAFVGILIFNVLIGNADAHSKNYSLLYSDGERRLSPFYDLVSTLAWPELSRTLAMKIGNCASVNVFSIGDWKKMAGDAGLGWPVMRERMVELNRAVRDNLDAVRAQASAHDEKMAKRLFDIISERCERLLEAGMKPGSTI